MAKGKGEIKGWITRNGVHIPIYGNYSVRGGVEPKAKGAKVKGKKKPDKYTNPRTGKRDHVQGKTQADLNKALKEQGLELDGAYQRAANEEKVYMYDKDGNVYSGTFNKYSDGGREIVNIERDKLDGESNVRNLDPDRDEHIKNGESKGAKWGKGKKKFDYNVGKGDYGDYVNSKNLEGLEEGLNSKGLKLDSADRSSMNHKNFNDERVTLYDKDGNTYTGTYNKYSDGGSEIVDIKKSAKKKPSMSEEDKTARTVADHYGVSPQEAKEGIKSGKYTEDNIKEAKDYKATMKDIEDKRDAGIIAAEDYESARRDAIKGFQESRKAKAEEGKKPTSFQEQVNDRFKTKKEWDEIAKNAGYKDSSDPEFQKNADDIVAKNKQESSKPDFSKMSYAEAGAYVAEHKKDFGLSEGADAYQAAYEMKKGTWEGKMPGQASSSKYDKVSPGGASEWSGITDRGVMDWAQDEHYKESATKEMYARGIGPREYQDYKNSKAQESSTPDFSKMSYSEAGKYVAEHKKDFGLSKDDDAYMAAYDIKNNGKKIGQRLLDNTTPEKEQRIKDNGWLGENGQLKRTEKSVKAGALPTTVSGLRSAYANATGSEKAEISAELRRKGYTLVGGKWVKGK